jgi:DDE superfamily endonuclease
VFYNYKGTFSIVLFALVDANYQFLYVDIGKPGSTNDAKVWQNSEIKKALDSQELNLPQTTGKVQYHFIGDDIFPLGPTLMKPYTRNDQMATKEKIFNYR